jgi:hypothetical protein
MSSTTETWMLSAHCSASDFCLSLAPDVADGVFKLLQLYEEGRQRMLDLEQHYLEEARSRQPSEPTTARIEDSASSIPRHEQRIIVRLSFTFNSGTVELHRMPLAGDRRYPMPDPRGRSGKGLWHDTFTLPTVSIWLDYAGPEMSSTRSHALHDSGALVINSVSDIITSSLTETQAVHESRNTLKPSILPFVVDLANRVEQWTAMKNASKPFSCSDTVLPLTSSSSTGKEQSVDAVRGSGVTSLRVTLRIDRSELRLSCAPDSNAYADLKWESGGLLASTTVGGQDVSSVAGTVSGVTLSLSHEFADQGRSCIEAGAKDLAFSVALCPGYEGDSSKKGLSVILDTQISAQFRLEAFSAWLIFTSVWIDNAPKLDLPLHTAIPEAAGPVPSAVQAGDNKVAVAALIRFRSIDFDTNIAVCKARLEITPIVLRTLSNGENTEVDLRIGVTQITAVGDISGEIRSESLTFNTVRRSSRATHQADPTILSMGIEAGDLSGLLFIGDTNVIRFQYVTWNGCVLG